jgi:hypothetical protein
VATTTSSPAKPPSTCFFQRSDAEKEEKDGQQIKHSPKKKNLKN